MGAYFHQDFYVSYGGVWETVDAFIQDVPEGAADLPQEIVQVLGTHRTEADLQAYLVKLGCEYRPQPGDGGYRGWLTEIARRASSSSGRS